MPTRYVFAISHFCEKARWTLGYLGIDHELAQLGPGVHALWSRRRGLPATTLPVLDTGDELIQGSAAIIDWADAIERELDWIDELLSDSRTYLVGDAFSRADLALSSLFSRAAGTRGAGPLPPGPGQSRRSVGKAPRLRAHPRSLRRPPSRVTPYSGPHEPSRATMDA